MTTTGIDSKGRRNPSAWKLWALSKNAPEIVKDALTSALIPRARNSGAGARARRKLARLEAQA